jgi:hypothetical protein
MNKSLVVKRQIADELRANAKLVDDYLEYAGRYANLCADHAEEVSKEIFDFNFIGGNGNNVSMVASLPLSRENPEQLRTKLEAVAKGASVSYVFVCRRTMTVYVFGAPNETHRTERA